MTEGVHDHSTAPTPGVSSDMNSLFTQIEAQMKNSAAYQQMNADGIDANESALLEQTFLNMVEQVKGSPLTEAEMQAAIEFCKRCFEITADTALSINDLAPAADLTSLDVLLGTSGFGTITDQSQNLFADYRQFPLENMTFRNTQAAVPPVDKFNFSRPPVAPSR
jgi:hypothetical protein